MVEFVGLKPLEVFALGDGMCRMTGSIPYTSLQWRRRYYEPGTFEMVIPANIYNPEWKYIYTDDRPETGMIQKVEYSDSATTENGIDTITLSGFFTEQILNDLIFLVEETEQEEYSIPKPHRVTSLPAKLLQTEDGTYIKEFKNSGKRDENGNWETVYQNLVTGEYVDKPENATYVDVKNGAGVVAERYPTSNPDYDEGDGKWSTGWYKTNYDYYSTETGKIVNVSPTGKETEYTILGKQNTGNVFYTDGEGTIYWAGGVVSSKDETYSREAERWEELSHSLETTVDPATGVTSLIAYRTVKGAWQLRTEIGEVGVSVDNVQTIIKWAQRAFGNSIIYDEPDFEGEKKILEPSLKRMGDMFFEEMKTIEASVRFFYSYKSDAMIFQIWRGVDRTQSQDTWPWAVFSDTWGSMYGYTVSRDTSNYRNKCYVLYDYDEPEWDDDGVPLVKRRLYYDESGSLNRQMYIPYTTHRDYEVVRLDDERQDRETYLDKRGDKPEGHDDWPRDGFDESELSEIREQMEGVNRAKYDAFRASIKQDGLSLLKNDYCEVLNMDTGTLSDHRYMEDFDLGDKVDMAIETLGIVKEARIIGADEVHEAGSSTVKLEIGEELVTETEKAGLI